MTSTGTRTTSHSLHLADVGPVDVTVDERGEGQPFLLLHGGAGPQSMADFADLFATTHQVRVITPVHPGFGGTSRPGALDSIGALAALYDELLAELGVFDVTVIGNSIGGWTAAELALLESPRLSGLILVDAVGIEVPGHPVADTFGLTLEQVMALSFHDPAPFRVDPTALPPAAQAAMASDQAALAAYTGKSMTDPSLARRLAGLETPTLVLWGDSDQIADPEYGRAYAAAIPIARFQLLTDTGHMPQLETPGQMLQAIWDSGDTDFSAQRDLGLS